MLSTRLGLGLIRPSSRSLISKTTITRSLQTITTTHEREQEILVAQRKNRPSSPHLTIYQPQLTWYLSSLHRVSGVLLAGAFYGVTVTYALGSILGLGIDSTVIADSFHSLSSSTQYALKGIAAFPFFFHFGNGIRHLIWDAGKELTLKGVYRTGYAVLGFSALAGAFYTFFWTINKWLWVELKKKQHIYDNIILKYSLWLTIFTLCMLSATNLDFSEFIQSFYCLYH